MSNDKQDQVELSVVMPCLNEAETLKTCIDKAKSYLVNANMRGEILVVDNGSHDGSQQIARDCGAALLIIENKGYGNVLSGAFKAAKGKYIIMGDSDDSYDFRNLDPFMEKLLEGFDLVIGNRFTGQIRPNAMPWINQYLGNPVLSFIARVIIGSEIGDFHCGLRGFKRDAIIALNLKTTGMEFASEMIVEATFHKLKIAEVPIIFSPAGRSRPPHLRPWRDGWRHLRFLFSCSPGVIHLAKNLMTMLARWLGRAARNEQQAL